MNPNLRISSKVFRNRASVLASILLISSALFFTGCQKNEDPVNSNRNYLVHFEKINNYSASFIKILLGSMNAAYPGIDTLVADVKYGFDLYSVTYKMNFKGNPITASGLVCIPSSDESFPILSFQNGTNTYKFNAPTVNPADPLYTLIEMMASHGYIVTIADYPGFGSSSNMLHPYYDKTATNDAVSHLIMAAHELVDDVSVKAGSNGKHYLMGYSQGGWATLASLKNLETSYPDSIPVEAASCGAGAYDIPALSNYVLQQQTFPGPLYLPYFIYSKITAGDISEPLETYFNEPYASLIPGLFDGNFTNTQVNEQLNDTIAMLLAENMRLNLGSGSEFASLRTAMAANSLEAWNPSATIRFYHGTSDLNVPPVQSDIMYNAFLSLGVSSSKVSLNPIPGATHESGLIPWGISSILWFDSIK